jgi:hypothetical protein
VPTFTVQVEVRQPTTEQPTTEQPTDEQPTDEQIRAAIDEADGREPVIGGGPSPHLQFAFVVEATDEKAAENQGQAVVRSLFGDLRFGDVRVERLES